MTKLKFPFKGERNGMKCMRCKRCGLIQKQYLWALADNSHFCKECDRWTEMISLDEEELNDKKFNPTVDPRMHMVNHVKLSQKGSLFLVINIK